VLENILRAKHAEKFIDVLVRAHENLFFVKALKFCKILVNGERGSSLCIILVLDCAGGSAKCNDPCQYRRVGKMLPDSVISIIDRGPLINYI